MPERVKLTWDEFLDDRRDFFRVNVHQYDDGRYDICLRIDGTYSPGADVELGPRADLVKWFEEWLTEAGALR